MANLYQAMTRFNEYKHPEAIVESAALSCVKYPEIEEGPSLHKSCWDVNSGKLSGPQLETISLAHQAHERLLASGERMGFICGDGTGTGKGRAMAGIIMDNYRNDRKKAVWFSVSADLKEDATRDLKAVCKDTKKIKIFTLPTLQERIVEDKGVLFVTYTMLTKEGKIPVTPSINKPYSRLEQIVDWLTTDFDGVIIFDEAHKAKGFIPTNVAATKIGKSVVNLQEMLPNARIVYVSATLASDPKELGYMTRIGLWGPECPFSTVARMYEFIKENGIAAKELLPVELKVQGLLVARYLDMSEIVFDAISVPLDKEFEKLYEDCCVLWNLVLTATKSIQCAEMKDYLHLLSRYWGLHQNFFRQLCVASKVDRLVELTKIAVAENKSVVIGIVNTGEAANRQMRASKYHNSLEICSALRMIIEQFMLSKSALCMSPKYLGLRKVKDIDVRGPAVCYVSPRSIKRKKSNLISLTCKKAKVNRGCEEDDNKEDLSSGEEDEKESSSDDNESENDEKTKLLTFSDLQTDLEAPVDSLISKHFQILQNQLPQNTLDKIISELGGNEAVAELTGRVHGQRIDTASQTVMKITRDIPKNGINLAEQKRFQNGDVKIAIISQAASTGISLHSSNDFKNQDQRLHVILDLPWSASNAVQQLGRTHRTNQKNAPVVNLIMSAVPAEIRFSASVASKIQSMSALSKGDSNTESNSLWKDHSLNVKFATEAIKILLKSLDNQETEMNVFSSSEKDQATRKEYYDYARSVGLFSDQNGAINNRCLAFGQFLNRILGLPIAIQHTFIHWMDCIIEEVHEQAESDGDIQTGIEDVQQMISGEKSWIGVDQFPLKSGQSCFLQRFKVIRGCSFARLKTLRSNWTFLKEKEVASKYGHEEVIAMYKAKNPCNPAKEKVMVQRPHSVPKPVVEERFCMEDYVVITSSEAEQLWEIQFKYLSVIEEDGRVPCMHSYRTGYCSLNNDTCTHAKLIVIAGILEQSTYESWQVLSSLMLIKIVKAYFDGEKFVGIYVSTEKLRDVVQNLSTLAYHNRSVEPSL